MFYTAFAQLISRITHPNEEVFQTLKVITEQHYSASRFFQSGFSRIVVGPSS